MKFLSSYRQLFSLPRFGISLFAAIAGKLRLGFSSVALLLEVAHYRGFDEAALVVSVSALAGLTLPLRGRLMDRYGIAVVTAPALVAYLAALTVLVLNEGAHGPFATTVAAACAAGLSAPPIQVVTRLMWREMATGPLRTTLLSLDAVLTDAGYIVGPTVAAFLVLAAPWAGLAGSALLSTVATLLLLVRGVPFHHERPRPAQRHWLGPLRDRVLRRTLGAAVSLFLAARAIELAFPAWAQQHDSPLMSGVLLSCMAVGSVVGGLVLGASPARWSVRATLPVTLAVLSLGTLLVAAASYTWTGLFVVAVAVMGTAVGPSFVAVYATAGDLSPANTAAETVSWISSFASLGGAAGTAVSGAVLRALGPEAVLVLSAVSLAIGSGLAHRALNAKSTAGDRVPETLVAANPEHK